MSKEIHLWIVGRVDMGRGSVKETVTRLINSVGRSPYLFIGSGFSRRYMGTDDWEGLLRHLCSLISDDPFLFDVYRAKCMSNDASKALPEVASMMERDLQLAVLKEEKFASFREAHSNDIRSRKSILKIMAAERLRSFDASFLTSELDILKEVGRRRVSGVITTNYDCLIESIFSGFEVFVGQEDLLFHRSFELGEIYKIHGSIGDSESMVLNQEDYEKLSDTQDYLAAKLLTIFMEYPIVFIGYSMNDPDIQSILRSIARCLGSERLSVLRDRFIFVSRGDEDVSTHSISYPDVGSIEMTKIATNDFGVVYEAIGDSRCSFSPRVIRELRKNIYKMVDGNQPSGNLTVEASFSDLEYIPEGQSFILGVGVASSSVGHGHMIKAEHLYWDVVFDDQHLVPKLVIEEYLPSLLGTNSGGLPMYKYLSAYSGEVVDPRILKEIEDKDGLDAYLNNALRKAKRNYHIDGKLKAVSEVIAEEGFGEAYKKLVLLDEAEFDLEELLAYMRKLIDKNRKIVTGNTELKRLIRIYDYLKYKKAFDKLANSE